MKENDDFMTLGHLNIKPWLGNIEEIALSTTIQSFRNWGEGNDSNDNSRIGKTEHAGAKIMMPRIMKCLSGLQWITGKDYHQTRCRRRQSLWLVLQLYVGNALLSGEGLSTVCIASFNNSRENILNSASINPFQIFLIQEDLLSCKFYNIMFQRKFPFNISTLPP